MLEVGRIVIASGAFATLVVSVILITRPLRPRRSQRSDQGRRRTSARSVRRELIPLLVAALLLLGLCGALLPALDRGGGDSPGTVGAVPAGSFATVNGTPLSLATLSRAYDVNRQMFDADESGSREALDLTIRLMIERELMIQTALAAGHRLPAGEAERRLQVLVDLSYGGDEAALEREAEPYGITLEMIGDDLANEMLVEAAFDEIGGEPEIAPAAVEQLYRDYVRELPSEREARLLRLETRSQAAALAAALADDPSRADSFAREYSLDETAAVGGLVHLSSQHPEDAPLLQALAGVEAGGVAGPIEHDGAYVVLVAADDERAGSPTFEELEPLLRSEARSAEQAENVRRYLASALASAETAIVYRSGYEPTPAPRRPFSERLLFMLIPAFVLLSAGFAIAARIEPGGSVQALGGSTRSTGSS